MAEDFVEGTAETVNYLTEKYWDQGYDKVTKFVNGKPVKRTVIPYRSEAPTAARSARSGRRSSAAAALAAAGIGAAAQSGSATAPSPRRKYRNSLPDPEPDPNTPVAFPRVRDLSEDRRSETSCEVIRAYEREKDDPSRKPESVLPARELRRDSAMTSYNDDYQQSYAASSRGRSQPAKSRYYDDDGDSDYDERSGRRYRGGNGRGYDDRDDRDYDRVVEETERYRGPVSAGPLVPFNRRESFRSGQDGPYGDGAMTQYSRRSAQDLDTYASSRRSKSRGRNRRDRSYSGSRSPSRERGGFREKLDETFDTTPRGLGVGLAGAVIGTLAGREFSHGRNQKRDMILGAIVGGLGANVAEHKYREWRDEKKEKLDRTEDRWEQKWDGRSRSSMR